MSSSTLRLGSLFTGYGGLDMGVTMALNTLGHRVEVTWCSDIEPGPCKIIAHHHPNVPNLGDITRINWHEVEPVDVIAGGSPCQDLSIAGRRAGMKTGTRSGLWASMCEAIETIQPRLVVWENVLGALNAPATIGTVEQCEFCMDKHPGNASMRALGRVVGDLAEIGYDTKWETLRASDIGACHHRERVFLIAWPRHAENPLRVRSQGRDRAGRSSQERANPTPRRANQSPSGLKRLPTPRAADHTHQPLSAGAARHVAAGNGALGEVLGTLQAPTGFDFQQYAPAIHRWEHLMGRPAPTPLETSKKGSVRLSPRFVEWMMGLPDGHVTGVPGIPWAKQLRALGNGVVPQQAAHAITTLLTNQH